MRVLLIDDLREIKADRVARTFEDGIKALAEEGPWDILYLDHDLGDENPKHTGYGVMCFLEEMYFNGSPTFFQRRFERSRLIRWDGRTFRW